MKRVLSILIPLFILLGLFDYLKYNKRHLNEGPIYLKPEYQIRKYYEPKGRYLKIEKICSSLHYQDYQLVNSYGNISYPIHTIEETEEVSQNFLLFDNLEDNHYSLHLKTVNHDYFQSNLIYINRSLRMSYDEMIEIFRDSSNTETVLDEFTKSTELDFPLIINIQTSHVDCFGANYKFYYNEQKKLFVDFFVGVDLFDNKSKSTLQVDKAILNEIQALEVQLNKPIDNFILTEGTNRVDFSSSFIKSYAYHTRDFNFANNLWRLVDEYTIATSYIK